MTGSGMRRTESGGPDILNIQRGVKIVDVFTTRYACRKENNDVFVLGRITEGPFGNLDNAKTAARARSRKGPPIFVAVDESGRIYLADNSPIKDITEIRTAAMEAFGIVNSRRREFDTHHGKFK